MAETVRTSLLDRLVNWVEFSVFVAESAFQLQNGFVAGRARRPKPGSAEPIRWYAVSLWQAVGVTPFSAKSDTPVRLR